MFDITSLMLIESVEHVSHLIWLLLAHRYLARWYFPHCHVQSSVIQLLARDVCGRSSPSASLPFSLQRLPNLLPVIKRSSDFTTAYMLRLCWDHATFPWQNPHYRARLSFPIMPLATHNPVNDECFQDCQTIHVMDKIVSAFLFTHIFPGKNSNGVRSALISVREMIYMKFFKEYVGSNNCLRCLLKVLWRHNFHPLHLSALGIEGFTDGFNLKDIFCTSLFKQLLHPRLPS